MSVKLFVRNGNMHSVIEWMLNNHKLKGAFLFSSIAPRLTPSVKVRAMKALEKRGLIGGYENAWYRLTEKGLALPKELPWLPQLKM